MSHETERAGLYRLRATQLRSKAASYKDREIGEAVIRVAEEYELLAHVFDGIDHAGLAALRAKNSN